MASEQVLKDISSSVSRVIESTNQFKTAVNENNKNIARIVKDIASAFNLEKNEMDHLDSSIASNSSQITQTNARINHTNSILSQSVALQNTLIQETKALRAEIANLAGFIQKNGEGGLGSTIANSVSGLLGKGKAGVMAGAAALGLGGGVAAVSGDFRNSVMDTFGLGGDKSSGGRGGRDGSFPEVGAGGTYSKEDAEKYKPEGPGAEFIAGKRAPFKEELNDLNTRKLLGAIISAENPGAGPAVAESLMNRTELINEERAKKGLPPLKLRDMILGHPSIDNGKSFYGPVRSGAIYDHLKKMDNPKEFGKMDAQINKALSGSYLIRSYTDQGSRGDPNYEAGGTGININGERFNHWGHSKSREWAAKREREYREAVEKGNKSEGSGDDAEKKLSAHIDKLFTLGGGVTGNKHNLEGISPELQGALVEALKEYKAKTGKAAKITSGHRTSEEQAKVGATYGIKARPGHSQHERGNAVDISEEDARAMEEMGILRKHGLHRPLGERDPVHIQMMPGYEKSPEQVDRENLEAAEKRKKARERDVAPEPRSDVPGANPAASDYKDSVLKAFGVGSIPSYMPTLPGLPNSLAGLPIMTGGADKSPVIPKVDAGYVPLKTEIASLELNKDMPDVGEELNNRQIKKEAIQLSQNEEQAKAAKKRLIDGENKTSPTTDPITGYGAGEAGNTNDKNVLPEDGWPQLIISKYA